MSENVIRSADLLPKATNSLKGAVDSVQGANNFLKDATDFVKQLDSVVARVQQMRGVVPQGSQSFGGGSPSAPSNKPQTIVEVQKEVVYKDFELDPVKVKGFVNDLLGKTALMLPDDIKNKPIAEITGNNWATFTYNYAGIEISSDQLAEIISTQLIEAVKKCKKD